MPIKSIVTFVHDHARDEHVLATAAALADAHGAHLSAVCLGIDHTNPGAYYAGANAIALQETLSRAQDDAARTEQAVRARPQISVARMAERSGVFASFMSGDLWGEL